MLNNVIKFCINNLYIKLINLDGFNYSIKNKLFNISFFIEKNLSNLFNNENKLFYNQLILIFKCKTFLLFNDKRNFDIFYDLIKKKLNIKNHKLLQWLEIQLDFLNIKYKNNLWIGEIESKFKYINDSILYYEKLIEKCYKKYENCEINSKKHLAISKKHLEFYLKLVKFKNIKQAGIILNDSEKKMGYFQLKELNIFEIKLNNYNMSNDYLNIILNLEKLKVNFYLEKNLKDLFFMVNNFCKLNIKIKNIDPIGLAIGNYIPKNLFEETYFFKQEAFKKYLLSFYLEILQKNKNDVFVNLKQLNYSLPNQINDRIKIVNINSF